MNILDEYTKNLLKALVDANVKFLVVGGYAVNYYGYYRTTGDIDLWLQPGNENKLLLIEALRAIETDEESLQALNEMDFSRHLLFSDGEEPFKIEFMTFISGVDFERAYAEKETTLLDGLEIPFISLQDLIISKMSSQRTKDKLDVEELHKISKYKKES
jgi:predicted nucleotidyltransferase